METPATPRTKTELLEELAAYLNDNKLGYQKAAGNAVNPDHQAIYHRLTGQREGFLKEVNRLIGGQGGQAEKSHVMEDELYRQWVDTQANATGGDDETLVQGNLKGEEWTLKAYDRALSSEAFSASEGQTLQDQRKAVQAAQTQLQGMRLSS